MVSGEIQGSSDGDGAVSFTQNYNPHGNIGKVGNELSLINIADGKTLNLSGNNSGIAATNIVLGAGSILNAGAGTFRGDVTVAGGTLNLGNVSRFVDGSIIGNGTSTVNLGSAAHTSSGNFAVIAGDVLAIKIISGTASGRITTSGAASNSADTKLNVSLANNPSYIGNFSSYKVIEGGAGSSIEVIKNEKISLNNSGRNRSGVYTFHTARSGDDLSLHVVRDSADAISSNHSEQHSYDAVDGAGDNATGELKAAQDYILNNDSITADERRSALQSLTPNDTGLNKSTFNAMHDSILTSENRLEIIRDSYQMAQKKSDPLGYKILDKNGVEVANSGSLISYASNKPRKNYGLNAFDASSYGDPDLTKGLWIQAFGTSAKQANKSSFNGYDSTTAGIAIGGDTKVDKQTMIGVSLSIADSRIKSSDKLKTTTIDSYQANIYAGKVYDKYFIDGIAGVTLNQYSSNRQVPIAGVVARANYAGQTYSAKIKAGFIEKFANNFELIPETSLIYARNHINSYSEKGAGTVGLQVTNRDANFLEGTVGLGLGYNVMQYGTAKIYPKIKISYGYDFIGNRQTATSNFVGQAVSFDTQSSKINRSSIKLDAGLNVYNLNNVTVSANYVLERKKTYQSHSGILRVRYDF